MRGGAIIVFVRFANPIRDPLLGAVISTLLLKNSASLVQEEEPQIVGFVVAPIGIDYYGSSYIPFCKIRSE